MRIGVIALSVLGLTSTARAQETATPEARPAPRHPVTMRYELEKRRLLAIADSMPADAFGTRIAADVKSFDEVIGHTVDTNFGVCAGARKVPNPRKDQPSEGVVTAKADLVQLVLASFTYCDSLFAALPAGSMASSDATFLATHLAQTTALMTVYGVMRGMSLGPTEAARAKPRER